MRLTIWEALLKLSAEGAYSVFTVTIVLFLLPSSLLLAAWVSRGSELEAREGTSQDWRAYCSTRNRGLRNASGIGLFLFLVSQWRQPARNDDAIPWALEILGQGRCVHTRRQHRLERFREGQMEAVDSRLGGFLSFCCVRNLHVGPGLNCAFS
jgi:hypothetical protein